MSDTLILNSSMAPLSVIPLSITPWQNAMKLLYLGKIKVLHHYDDWAIHSQHMAIPVPAVAITTEFFDFKKKIRYSKSNVFLRDLYQCQYCRDTFDSNDLTIDHVVPRALGGKTSWTNCATACEDCNTKKADKTHMKPFREPFQPDSYSMMYAMKDSPIRIRHNSWAEYLKPYRKIVNG